MKVKSTITLSDFRVTEWMKDTNPLENKEISLESIKDDFYRLLCEAQDMQQDLIDSCDIEIENSGTFANGYYRHIFKDTITAPSSMVQGFDFKEKNIAEALRLISGYQTRLAVASVLEENNWELTYNEVSKRLKDSNKSTKNLDYQLYNNILSSKSLPSRPKVKNPVLPYSKVAHNHTYVKRIRDNIVIERFPLWGRYINIIFPSPVWQDKSHYGEFVKYSKPNVRLDRDTGVLCFDFVLFEEVVKEAPGVASVLSVDPGVCKPMTASRVYADGRVSEEFTTSIETDRSKSKYDVLELEHKRAYRKLKRKRALGLVDDNLAREVARLSRKKRNTKTHVVWNAANDLANHTKTGEVVGLENNNFSTGSWNNGELDVAFRHVLDKRGINYKYYSAKDASHLCPNGHSVDPSKDRVSECLECEWCEDRDYTASIIGGLRTIKKVLKKPVKPIISKSRQKSKPTPKRPKRPVKNSSYRVNGDKPGLGNTYTRVILPLLTARVGNPSASNVLHTGEEPQENHNPTYSPRISKEKLDFS